MPILVPTSTITSGHHAISLSGIDNTLVVLQGVHLITEGANKYAINSSGFNNTILVNGYVAAEGSHAITFVGYQLATQYGSAVTIGATGQVFAGGDGLYGTEGNNTAINNGSITAGGHGIHALGDGNAILNTGTISAGVGIKSFNSSITNDGAISASTVGIVMAGDTTTASSHISNHGTITALHQGIVASGYYTNIENSGTVVSSTSAIASSGITAFIHINNSGSLQGNTSFGTIRLDGVHHSIVNSGSIINNNLLGQAIRLSGDRGTIINTGTLTAFDTAIRSSGDETQIDNHGIVTGGLLVGGRDVHIFNSGILNGELNFGVGAGAEFSQSEFTNSGKVFSDTYGIEMMGSDNTLSNSGDMESKLGWKITGEGQNTVINTGSILLHNGNLMMQGTGNELINSGQILSNADGIFLSGYGASSFDNRGIIVANGYAVTGSFGQDLIYNSGNISGDVILHDANDVFHGKNGFIDGIIDAGSGDDIIFSGGNNDQVFGGIGADIIGGGVGNDALRGNKGDDTLYGNSGRDRLWGGHGDDVMFGGHGNDRLIGGHGADTMTGGGGSDVFVFRNNTGYDTIVDFVLGEDILDLRYFNLSGLTDVSNHLTVAEGNTILDLTAIGGVGELTILNVDSGLTNQDFLF